MYNNVFKQPLSTNQRAAKSIVTKHYVFVKFQ